MILQSLKMAWKSITSSKMRSFLTMLGIIIGIMNIMLVSVTERTREIGIRKAIGASNAAIMSQFLIEALVLCLMGCVIGVALSELALLIISAVAQTTYAMNAGVVIVAVMFSVVIGMLFSIYPALKAARKKPIDALRAI